MTWLFKKFSVSVFVSLIGFVISLLSLIFSPLTYLPYPSPLGAWHDLSLLFWAGYLLIIVAILQTFIHKLKGTEPTHEITEMLPLFLFFLILISSPYLREGNPRGNDMWNFLLYIKTFSKFGYVSSPYESHAPSPYHEWPGLFILSTISQLVLGSNVFLMYRFLSIIFPAFLFLTFYQALRSKIDKSLVFYALIAFVVFSNMSGVILFSPQFFGLTLFPLCIYLSFRLNIREYFICWILISIGIIITHPISSIYVLGMLMFDHFIARTLIQDPRSKSTFHTILFLVFFFGWGMWSASQSSEAILIQLSDYLKHIYLLGMHETVSNPLGGVYTVAFWDLELYYSRVTRYFLLFLSLLGWLRIVQLRKYDAFRITTSVVFGSFYTLPLWIGVARWQFWDRGFFFVSLAVPMLVSSLLYPLRDKTVKKSVMRRFSHIFSPDRWRRKLILVTMGFLLILLPFKFMQYSYENNMFYNDWQVSSASFLSQFSGENAVVLSDDAMRFILKFFNPQIEIRFDPYFYSDAMPADRSARYTIIHFKTENVVLSYRGQRSSYTAILVNLSMSPEYNRIYDSHFSTIHKKFFSED